MIEAHEDISLVVEQQNRDVKESRQQYQAIAEGRQVHPAILQQQTAITNATTLQVIPGSENTMPPENPTASLGTVPVAFKLLLAVVFILLCLFIRQRLKQQESD